MVLIAPSPAAASAAPLSRSASDPRSLIGLSRDEIGAALTEAGVPERQVRMRTAQLWHWLYVRGLTDFALMSNVGKDLRTALADRFTLARPEIVTEQVSEDG